MANEDDNNLVPPTGDGDNATPPADGKGEKDEAAAKFTQEDLNKFAATIRAEEKKKAETANADLKRQAELAAMADTDRLKAEKEDSDKKLAELQKQIDFGNQKTEALAKLGESKLDTKLIDVLMSDKSHEDKIKLIAEVQQTAIDAAIKAAMPSHTPSGPTGKSVDGKESKVKYGFEKFK